MPPLTRQESWVSIFSWWSDSNPLLQGPTINLHAAAKPLMRLMYHHQALDIIKKNRGSPLCAPMLETYSSYFPLDYVSWSTKAAILSELSERARLCQVDARAVVDSPVFPHVAQMLRSRSSRTRGATCRLLRTLTSHESTIPAILKPNTCEPLLALLRDNDSEVIMWATDALSQILQCPGGMQAIVNAKAMDYILLLLESPSSGVRKWTCELVAWLATQESTRPAFLNLKPCVLLVSLLGDNSSEVINWVMFTLSEIARSMDAANAIVDAKALDHALRLLESPSSGVRKSTCQLVGRLASHESTVAAILNLKPCLLLVSLLSADDSWLIGWAMYALCGIAQWVDGARAIVEANALDPISLLLESSNPYSRARACELLKRLASYGSTAPAVLNLKLFWQLVCLLWDPNKSTRDHAISTLEAISEWPEGVAGLIGLGGDVLERFQQLRHDQSLDFEVRDQIQKILQNITRYEAKNYPVHKSLFIDSAMCGLSEISLDSANAIVDARARDHVLKLLQSPRSEIRVRACKLVGRLATRESTVSAILEVELCVPLVSLLCDNDCQVIDSAMYALSEIAQWVGPANAIVDARGIDHVLALLESPSSEVRKLTCKLVGRLATHESTVSVILDLKPCVPLVSLLQDDDSPVIIWATYALSQIAQRVDGAQAVVNAKVMNHISLLLESTNAHARTQACELLEMLACHNSTAPAILDLKLFQRLVPLLWHPNNWTRDHAISALKAISEWPAGVAALTDMGGDVLERLQQLSHDQFLDLEIRDQTRKIVDRIAWHMPGRANSAVDSRQS